MCPLGLPNIMSFKVSYLLLITTHSDYKVKLFSAVHKGAKVVDDALLRCLEGF